MGTRVEGAGIETGIGIGDEPEETVVVAGRDRAGEELLFEPERNGRTRPDGFGIDERGLFESWEPFTGGPLEVEQWLGGIGGGEGFEQWRGWKRARIEIFKGRGSIADGIPGEVESDEDAEGALAVLKDVGAGRQAGASEGQGAGA